MPTKRDTLVDDSEPDEAPELLEDVEAAIRSSSKRSSKKGVKGSLGPILSDVLSNLPPQIVQSLGNISAVYRRWIRPIILVRIAFSALTNPSRISGVISGGIGLGFAHLWLSGHEWRQRAADSVLSMFVVSAVYIKSDPATFQLLLGDFYRRRDSDARQLSESTSTPYRAPLAYCLEPFTSPLAFCYDPVVFIPAMLILYKRLSLYFTCPGLEGRLIDGLSILTALLTTWVLFPEFSWNYALDGRAWTTREVYHEDVLGGP
ncbi:hypothetical protein TWF481_011546 [Arthrobotrys musiformis]|uniref:Mannosyltransferase n=1 Tax=Arthrobotrys musiformis TaxID=47236 RepID=A0AAV9VYL3_9PEZI